MSGNNDIIYDRVSQPCMAHTPLSLFVRMSFHLLSNAVLRCIIICYVIYDIIYANITKNCVIFIKLVYAHLQLYMGNFYNGVLETKRRLKILTDI